ncbi:MAG: ABC transporter ATP-binding protein, partial [bacterium]|nr:ABC transporter ATP-binding protein [bacterium]
MNAIETENLSKVFPQVKKYRDIFLHPWRKNETVALKNITLQVKQGELFSLLGPTGAGKTTLLKILCNLVLPSSGRAMVNDFDVEQQGAAIRQSVGYVFSDERSFYWRLTGRQNLLFFAHLNNFFDNQAEQRVEQVLQISGASDFADNVFKNYSAGQRQKLAIARGLITDPPILLMDEPTRSLDPEAAKRLREFIRERMV